MPTRRRMIALTATAAAGISGCVEPPEEDGEDDGDGGNDSGNVSDGEPDEPSDNETDSEDDEDEGTEAEPEFEFVELSAPEEVELNESFQVEFTVENVGDADGTYETEVRHQFAWSDYSFVDVELEIPAGETGSYTSEEFSMPYIGWFEFETPDFNERVRTNSARPRLSVEDSFVTPRGIEISVTNVETTNRYGYTGDNFGGRRSPPGNNTKWARFWVTASNPTDRARDAPALTEFDCPQAVDDVVDDEEMDDGYRADRRITEDGTREGWVVFEVPDDLRASDLSLTWEREFDEGESRARWDS